MIDSKHYSTIVVGCGPAGIMAAKYAAQRGPVLLIDAKTLPRDKSCGGMLNEYAQKFIAETLKSKLPASILSDPKAINFRFFDWDRSLRRSTTLCFVNAQRSKFDEWLMGFLPDNVEIADNTRFITCSQTSEQVTVRLRQADDQNAKTVTASCDYLVGADGPRSEVRRSLPVSQLSLYKTVQDYLPRIGDAEAFFDCVYARHIGSEYGYGYVIPKGDTYLVGSVFYPDSKNVRSLHETALELYSSYFPYSLDTIKREAWSAIWVRSVSDIIGGHGRVLLAGEGGGIFSPSSGEGISFALNSGTLAGSAIAHAHEGETVVGKRNCPSIDESDALRIYRASLDPIKRNIRRRLMYYPVLNSNWGKTLAKYAPSPLLDLVTHQI